jgi:ligand-binding sensor domain-containing protein
MRSLLSSIFILICYFSLPVTASEFNWEIVTNLNDAKEIDISNDQLMLATSGGLVSYNLANKSFDVFTTENGISDHHFTTMSYSDKGLYILGTQDGVITFFDLQSETLSEDFSLQGNEIVAIHAIEDTLWIASKTLIAVYLYSNDRETFQFRDFYTNFNQAINQFYSIYYYDNRIWAASDNGLLYASGNFLQVNLKSAESWNVLTTIEGLPHNTIYSINSQEDTLFIGTASGLSVYFEQNFQNFGSTAIKHIQLYQNQIYVDNGKIVYRFEQPQFINLFSTSVNSINDFGFNSEGQIWISFAEKGLSNSTTEEKIWFNGPIDNILGHMVLNSRGELWAMSGIFGDQRTRGFSVRLASGKWRNYRYLNNWRNTASAQRVIEDAAGNMWVGSWNGGLTIFDADFEIYHFNNYTSPGELWISSSTEDDTFIVEPPDSVRHYLSYTNNSPDLLVVTDMLLDESNDRIWLTTLDVRSEKPIIQYQGSSFSDQAYDSTNWIKYGIPDAVGVSGTPTAAITKDIFGNLWFGTQRNGVVALQIEDSGQTNWLRLSESDNLKSNNCFSVAADQDGYIWLGTISGLNAYFNGNLFDFREDYQPIGLIINAIYVDSENNKWFATDKGVSLLLSRGSPWDPESWIHFVPKNSESIRNNLYYTNLPSEEIRSIFVDELTGDVYCSTLSGIAILRSNPFTTPLKELNQVKVGPIPLHISEGKASFLYFRNLTGNSEVKILTANGRLVRALNLKNSTDFFGSFARWNGRNEDGRLVSSGVYIYLITDEAGNSSSGKFLIIRE